jgi:protein-tyrosine phosphatase
MVYHILAGLYLIENANPSKSQALTLSRLQMVFSVEETATTPYHLGLEETLTPAQLRATTAELDHLLQQGLQVGLKSQRHAGYAVILVLAYLMTYQGMDLPNAYTLVSHNVFMIRLPQDWLKVLVETFQLDYKESELAYHQFAPRLVGKVADSLSRINELLYLGSITAMQRQQRTREAGIQAVLRLDSDSRHKGQWGEGFTLFDLPLFDGQDMESADLRAATRFIHSQVSAGQPTLVHCQMGVSRSVTMVLAYLIEYEQQSLAQAYVQVVKRRAIAHPHPRLFWSLVREYNLPYSQEQATGLTFRDQLLLDQGYAAT